MKIKVNVGWIQVTCEGENKAKVLKDLAGAQEFVKNNLDVKAPVVKKKKVRKPKKQALEPLKVSPVVPRPAPKKDPIVKAPKTKENLVAPSKRVPVAPPTPKDDTNKIAVK
jgi:hypothetical protein